MSESQPAPTVTMRPAWWRWPLRIGLSFGVLLCCGLGWLLGTESGLGWIAGKLPGWTAQQLHIGTVHGRLLGRLQLRQLSYNDGQGTRVAISQLDVDWVPAALLHGQVHIRQLRSANSEVSWPSQPAAAPSDASGFSLPQQAPIDIRIDQLQLGPTALHQDRQLVLQTQQLDFAGSWLGRQIQLDRLVLDAVPGHIEAHGQVQLGQLIHGQLAAQAQWLLAGHPLSAQLKAEAKDADAELHLQVQQPSPAELNLKIQQTGTMAWQAQLLVPRMSLAALGLDSPIQQAGLQLHAHGDRSGGIAQAQLDLDQIPVQLDPLQLSYQPAAKQLLIEQLHLHSPKLSGQVDLHGQVDLAGAEPRAQLRLQWHDLNLPAAWVGQPMRSEGQLKFEGQASQFTAGGGLSLGPPQRMAKLQWALQGSPKQIQLQQLSIQQAGQGGQLQAHGQVDLQPALRWQLQLAAQRFDPGVWLPDWPGALDLQLNTQGQMSSELPTGTIELTQLAGQLRHRGVHGHGQLQIDSRQVLSGQLALQSGHSSMALHAPSGAQNQLQLDLNIPQADDWLPSAHGQLIAKATYQGPLRSGALQLQLHAQQLVYQQQHLDTLGLQAAIPNISKIGGQIHLRAANAAISGLKISRLAIDADGNEQAHQLQLQLVGQPISTDLRLHGGYVHTQWDGQLTQWNLDLQGLPRWALRDPVGMHYAANQFRSSELCLGAAQALICASAAQSASRGLDACYRLHALPIGMLLNAAGMNDLAIKISGQLDGAGQIHRSPAGVLTGQANILAAGGQIQQTDAVDPVLFNYGPVQLQALLQPKDQRLDLHAEFSSQAQDHALIDGQLHLQPSSQQLSGHINFNLPSLGFMGLLSPQLAAVQGHAGGQLQLGGRLKQPMLIGSAAIQDFAAEVPAAGIKLSQGQVQLHMLADAQAALHAQLHSGDGDIQLDGQLSLDPQHPSHLELHGQHFTATDIPAAKVIISPGLVLDYLPTGIKLGGQVHLDTAAIDISKLPGAGAQAASADVVVLGTPPPTASKGLPITAQVSVDLGQHTDLRGMGLDGHLSGQLNVLQTPGQAPVGQGQISVDGSYKAYGQNLSIEHGQILFASTPLDNPGLNLQAIRKINTNLTVDDGQRVGLAITGTAQKPVINLYSNPPMDQSDVLAYMTTGKPLSQLSNGETSMVNSAAQAMGSMAGNYLAQHVGSKLGIDEIGVSSSDALNGNSAFTVGKYLTPRLYLSYGVGLFEPGQVVTLRYRISRRWNVEAQSATEFSRTSLNYRLER